VAGRRTGESAEPDRRGVMRARKPGDEAGSWRADRWWWRAELHGARRVIAREQPGGRWRYPGGNPQIHSRAAYDQLQTYRQVAVLVCKYGLDRQHPAFPAAAVFLASFWTEAGDYRGIYGRQCTPNHSAPSPSSSCGPGTRAARKSRTPCDGCWPCARTTAAGPSPPETRVGRTTVRAGIVPEGLPGPVTCAIGSFASAVRDLRR